MLSRLFIIGFLLCLPIAISLLSQQMAYKVAAPKLPASVLKVKLAADTAAAAPEDAKAGRREISASYTPRLVKHVAPMTEADYNPKAPTEPAGKAARPAPPPNQEKEGHER